jgi:hypothetical protein
VSGVVALSLLVCAARAHAAELRWRGAAECERKDNVAAQVERLIGRPLADVPAVDFEVEVQRGPAAAPWRLRVQTVVPEGEITPSARELSGASCDEVSDAAALAIAMAVQERVQDGAPASEPVTPAAPEPSGDTRAAQPTPEGARSVSPPAPPGENGAAGARTLRIGVGLGVLLDGGALPSLAPGGQVEVSGTYAALRLSLFGAAFVPQREDVPGEDRGGEFQLVLGGIRACAAPGFGEIHVMGCTGFELGQLSGEGQAVRVPRTKNAGWRAVLTEIGASWEFATDFAALVRVGAAWPLSRPEFVLDGTIPVHRPAGLDARALFGLEMYL